MKKLIFTLVAIFGLSFSSQAQCGERATMVCGTCYSVQIPLTGILSVDTANFIATGGTMLRKPNLRELSILIDEFCW